MENYYVKKVMSTDKGITLISLVITVVVMLIIVGISINVGTESLDTTRLQGFYMQLETIQKKADDIAITNEIYVNSDGETIDIKNYEGFKLTESEKDTLASTGINLEEIKTGLTDGDFRYFTVEELDTVLDLTEMEYNVFIHFDTRTVIAEDGITINGQKYYMLESNIYFSEYNKDKNKGEITLEYDISTYGTDKYKIIVKPSKVGDLEANGTLRYKKTTTKYWETANGLEIIVSELTQYNIEYRDKNNNIATGLIDLEANVEGEPILKQHKFVSTITITPGCTTEGIMTYTCSICGDLYTEAIKASGHNYDEGKVTTQPKCDEEGVMTYTCSVCGYSYTQAIPVTGHSYTSAVTKIPTATTEGEITYTCSVCGYKYTEPIPAVGE